MRISDWSSDVCSSDLWRNRQNQGQYRQMSEIRIDVVLYPGAQLAAAMGLADLFEVANRIAEGIDQIPSRLRVRHLRTGKGAEPAPAFDTDTDTARNRTGPSDVMVLLPSLETPNTTEVAAPIARGFCNRHGVGSVLAPGLGEGYSKT